MTVCPTCGGTISVARKRVPARLLSNRAILYKAAPKKLHPRFDVLFAARWTAAEVAFLYDINLRVERKKFLGDS